MNESALRQDIIEIGRRLFQREFVASNDGNISVRISDRVILITPTGVSKGFMNAQDLLRVDVSSGKVLSGRLKPSSEMGMHLEIYKSRPDVQAVVHAHPPTATGFSVAGIAFDDIALPEAVIGLGNIALTRYATPGTEEVPEVVKQRIVCSDVLLLANHGAITVGDSLFQAYYRMESLEQVAKIMLVARLLGNVNVLSDEQQAQLFHIREKMGLREYSLSCDDCGSCSAAVKNFDAVQPEQNGAPTAQPSEADVRAIVARVCEELNRVL